MSPSHARLIAHVAAGETNKEAAYSLGLSERTVKVYLTRIYDELGMGPSKPGNARVLLSIWAHERAGAN